MYRSGYHRVSDDSVSSYGGHPTFDAALKEAKQNLESPDIDEVWVRGSQGELLTRGTKTVTVKIEWG